MMKLNRTYLQKRLKNNLLAKLTYEIFVLHNAKRFLDNKSQWKFVQEGNLKKILGYACEHTAYYKSLYSQNKWKILERCWLLCLCLIKLKSSIWVGKFIVMKSLTIGNFG